MHGTAHPPYPLTRDLVLVGGGHTHALILRRWGMSPLPGVRVTVIDPSPTAAYSGMLPGFVAGHYRRGQMEIDLVRLARHAGARLILAPATGLDLAARGVLFEDRPATGYDVLSIDIGVTSRIGLPGFEGRGVPAKPLDAFADRWQAFVDAGGGPVAVIGGGAAGCELAMAAAHRLGSGHAVTVIEAGRPLAGMTVGTREAVLSAMRGLGISVLTGTPAARLQDDRVILADGREVAAQMTISAAGARPAGWLAGTGLHLTDGYITVDDRLRANGRSDVFAAGDIAHLVVSPRPKAGVFAVRAAPVLFANLVATLQGQTPHRRFRPQADYLKLLSLGGKRAVADKWGLSARGEWAWAWKDRIDRSFMDRLTQMPHMPVPTLPYPRAAGLAEVAAASKPLCGGCGAKVGMADLRRALAALPPPGREDVLSGAGDDAATLAIGGARQLLTTDHLRAFTEDSWLMACITAVHAMGDIWSKGGQPQVALAQVILPRMSPSLMERTLAEIMNGAARTFGAAGADVVGGHTSLGAELTIGFTVTGLAGPRDIGQSGARPGDALILTKAIGTGVILAAEMARQAPGRVVAAALSAMARPQGHAAAILAPVARAMTDVTGFGLAGHLMGVLEASDVGARLVLSAVPLLDGALALSVQGHGSTLLAANRSVTARMTLPDDRRADLLFDPQTAGGLLAAVPGDSADEVLHRLTGAGEAAAIIGRVTDGPIRLTVTD